MLVFVKTVFQITGHYQVVRNHKRDFTFCGDAFLNKFLVHFFVKVTCIDFKLNLYLLIRLRPTNASVIFANVNLFLNVIRNRKKKLLTFYEPFRPAGFLLKTSPVKAVSIQRHNPVKGIFHCGRRKKAIFLRENTGEAIWAGLHAISSSGKA